MTNYSRGASFERRVRDHLRGEGYFVVRSAQSKGDFDLVALKLGEVLLVQCKANKVKKTKAGKPRLTRAMTKAGLQEIAVLAASLGAVAVVASRGAKPRCELKLEKLEVA